MITKDLQAYADCNWTQQKDPVTNISKISDGRTSLVVSDILLYNFDKICLSIFPSGQVPTSTDGLAITPRTIELIEFKSGFKQKITKNNFNAEVGFCKPANKNCDAYWNLFFENQKRKIDELISSIRLKAIESYITLEKHVFPCCTEHIMHKQRRIILIVVIDEDGIDSLEDTLAELAEIDTIQNNCFVSIKKALRRLKNQHDASSNTYYYDSIEVMSIQEFSSYLCMPA